MAITLSFPDHSRKFDIQELILRDTSGDSEYIQKVASVCKWWMDTALPMEITTSGSTGEPKKICFERSAILESINMSSKALGLKAGMNALLALDPSFIGGRMMILRCIEIGMNLICLPPSSNPLKDLNETIDFASFVPLQLETMVADHYLKNRLNSIKTILVGGAPMSQSLRKKTEQLTTAVYLSFGMTETLSHIALQKIEPDEENFKVLDGIQISIDERGCLVIHASHLNEEKIITNDLVELTGPDTFKWIGRFDRVINSGGIKLSPEVLESKSEELIKSIFSGDGFFFSSVKDDRLGDRLVLILISMTIPSSEEIEKIVSVLRLKLGTYEMPKAIFLARAFEKTSGGKLDRKNTLAKANCVWQS